jgi:hypothetical protein
VEELPTPLLVPLHGPQFLTVSHALPQLPQPLNYKTQLFKEALLPALNAPMDISYSLFNNKLVVQLALVHQVSVFQPLNVLLMLVLLAPDWLLVPLTISQLSLLQFSDQIWDALKVPQPMVLVQMVQLPIL